MHPKLLRGRLKHVGSTTIGTHCSGVRTSAHNPGSDRFPPIRVVLRPTALRRRFVCSGSVLHEPGEYSTRGEVDLHSAGQSEIRAAHYCRAPAVTHTGLLASPPLARSIVQGC